MSDRKLLVLKVAAICVLMVWTSLPFWLWLHVSALRGWSPTTIHILRASIWPLPYILTVLICGGILLFAAKVAHIERRSYGRAATIVAIGLGLACGAQPAYNAFGWGAWISVPINNVLFFLPISPIFRTSVRKSLLAYLIAFALTAGLAVVLFGLAMALGVRPN